MRNEGRSDQEVSAMKEELCVKKTVAISVPGIDLYQPHLKYQLERMDYVKLCQWGKEASTREMVLGKMV